MFDNLREMSDDSGLFQEVGDEQPAAKRVRRKAGKKFLGMTPGQRFILSVLLLFTVVVMGMMCLLVTQKLMIG
jgi:hypothetical protein